MRWSGHKVLRLSVHHSVTVFYTFPVLVDNKLIFVCVCVFFYIDDLQIKFEFHDIDLFSLKLLPLDFENVYVFTVFRYQ